MKKCRADERLVAQMNLESVELARALIMEGRVFAGEKRVAGAGQLVEAGQPLRVRGEIAPYASRGAYKLKKALEVFSIDLKGRVCLDVGASTGGFTDVMLRAGASLVYAVDVGYNLLSYRLRSDERVRVMERVNARFLQPQDFAPRPSFGATDVSFISLEAVLPAATAALEGEDRRFVALVKPQFEAPREDVGEKGVVRSEAVHRRVLERIIAFVPTMGWTCTGLDFSPVRGAEGNIEFLLEMRPAGNNSTGLHENAIRDTIHRAYDKFIKM